MRRNLLLILLCLPFIGFGQKNLTGLMFQLIDSKDARSLVENKGWETKSMNDCTEYGGAACNEFTFSKKVRFGKNDYSNCWLTIKEYKGYSNEVYLTVANKKFFNHFRKVILKSSYTQISKDVEKNVIETTYRRSPLQADLKENLNNFYRIKLLNYHHNQTRENNRKQHVEIVEDEVEIEDTEADEEILVIEEEDDDDFHTIVENMPEFPGGDLALMKYLQRNIRYPSVAKEYNITGKVYVNYIVDKKGYVTNVKIVRGVDKSLDAEALRVVKSLPKYKPGKQRGKPVRVQFTIPINFTLN